MLEFNPKKSKVIVFKKNRIDIDLLRPVQMNDIPVDFVDTIKYLGITLVSKPTLSYSAEPDLRSFYSILNVINGPNEIIMMHLLYANCAPILTFGIPLVKFDVGGF